MSADENAMHVRVAEPRITFLPETEASKIVTHDLCHNDLLSVYNYVSREYLISGIAITQSYCTRLLLRCPADPARFSGLVIEEPSHLWGGTTIWRLINRWLMRNGHAWLEVDSQAPAAIDQIKNVDPERYKQMHFIPGPRLEDFISEIPAYETTERLWDNYKGFKDRWWSATVQSLEILTAASHAVRAGRMGIRADRVVLCGLCQTADLTRKFILEAPHLRLPNGYAPFEGFMPCQSEGGEALPDLAESKIIEIIGELEINSIKALYWSNGMVEELPHRRPDSNSFRLYEVAGMSHRETRYLSVAERKRLSTLDLGTAQWSTFTNSFVFHAIFDAMDKWIKTGAAPPRGARLEVNRNWEIERDEHGNALAGVRTVHTDVPTSRLIDFSPKPRPHWQTGSEVPFTDVQMWALYKSVENYRRQAGEAVERQIQAGFLLPEDAEVLRRDTIEQVSV
ncbi:hypothetical protein N7457_004418 [Penicillium paradoxum]|uniref:uncharacterized protein n=1 Tax=Penicillium paradoxum TaxID=176176 RepID=UPI002547E883|nr:uncharacterized protein N7457_004418 [Penicillium paradoxum]KAJ5782644.1 hypothetical protein N7457_004418 [Penicillium paradoxum]